MEKSKKIVTISTIVATAITSIWLIMLLFGAKPFGDFNGAFITTFASLAVGGFFTINSLNMIDRNKIIGWVSLGLIVASVLLISLTSWIKLESDAVSKATIVLGVLSVLFNIIVSSGLELGKTKLALQIIVYVVVGATCLFFTLILFNIVKFNDVWVWFVTSVILSVLGVIVLKVLAKKTINDVMKVDKDMVRISKTEYQMLVEKAKKYDELVSKNQENA